MTHLGVPGEDVEVPDSSQVLLDVRSSLLIDDIEVVSQVGVVCKTFVVGVSKFLAHRPSNSRAMIVQKDFSI